jgi:hypothetical protein
VKAVTVKSEELLDEALQLEIHYAFGMEHYTDYVFKPRDGKKYSVTLVMDESKEVMDRVVARSVSYPDQVFILEVLEIEQNTLSRFAIQNGKVVEQTK